MIGYCLCRVGRLAAYAAVVSLLVMSAACADYTVVFSDNFDDGNWTANPLWTASPADPSVSISSERSTSAPYSLKIAANNNSGAIRTGSGIIAADEPFTCTFNLYVESIAEEGIPFCLQDLSNSIVLIVFLLKNGSLQFSEYTSTGWHSVNLPYPLTYNQWHSFRIVFDGVKYDLFLDGHATADVSLTKQINRVPAQLVIGNFGSPHTGTFYVDDLLIRAELPPPPQNPGKIYVQFCSDTSTGGLGTNTHYNTFPVDDYSYVSPDGQAAQIMAESWRDAHRDSFGNPMKLTWYMNVGSIYSGGVTTGPIFPYELMMDHHGEAIARWGDEMAYHYHTWFWDGTAWTQHTFEPCLPDFEMTTAHFILDRNFFPCSFRSGWEWMDNYWNNYLDKWYPYRFEGKTPNGSWTPYHPSSTDWRLAGDCRGWECTRAYTPNVTAAQVEAAFAAAYQGRDQVICYWSHLKEVDFVTKISEVHSHFLAARQKYPMIDFEYLTAREEMIKWQKSTDYTPPVVSVSTSDLNGVRTAAFSTNEPIYQLQPFVAIKKTDGTYTRLDCTTIDSTHWQVSYNLADTLKIAVGLTDMMGNATVKEFPTAFHLWALKATQTSTTIDVTWETNHPADSRIDYQLMPSGSVYTNPDPALVTSHHITLTGLEPGRVYKLDVSSVSAQGERAAAKSIYVLTEAGAPVVVDNTDPNFSVTGTWTTAASAAGRYGADYRYRSTSTASPLYANWAWVAPTSGFYRVSLWWSQGSNRCPAARYSVLAGEDEHLKTFNQQTDGGKWNEHGVYYLDAGQVVTVRLSSLFTDTSKVVIADAVKFEPAYATLSSISLGRLIPDGGRITLPQATVTAVFDGYYFVQEKTGIPGVKVMGAGVVEGATVQVSGVLSTVNGERVITQPLVN